jgi:hypothetical protein
MGKSDAAVAPGDAVAEGRRLAIAMLREFRDLKPEECSCEDHFRPGRAQRDVFGRYLELLSSSEIRRGFGIVMNDFLAAAPDLAADVGFYEQLEADGYDRNAEYFPAPAY